MPKHPKSYPARIRTSDMLSPGEIKVVEGEMLLVSCPTCATKDLPRGTVFMPNVGSTGGDPWTCPACGYVGHIVDGSWRKM